MNLNDLRVLLALNGNVRIEYAEEEIFSNNELYGCYLESIASNTIGIEWALRYHNPETTHSLAWLAYVYAKNVIEGRWPEAEHLIATIPCWAFYYAKNVIEGRWPEAEHLIAKDKDYADHYNARFGTNI